MRRRLPVLLAFLLALGVAVWLLLRGAGAPHANPAGDEGARAPAAPAPLTRPGLSAKGTAPSAVPGSAGSSAAGNASRAEAGERHVAVVGRVVGERRMPAADVSVTWQGWAFGSTGTAKTDSSGRFRIAVLGHTEGPRWLIGTLIAQGGARGSTVATTVRFALAAEVDLGTFELRPAARVRVTATGTGGPASGARIMLLVSGEEGSRPTPFGEATADEAGVAVFEGVPPGFVNVWGESRVGEAGRAHARASAGAETPVALQFEPAEDVDLLVVEEGSGKPVAGARIELVVELRTHENMSAEMDAVPPRDVAPTDAAGHSHVARVTHRDVVARASAPGFTMGSEPLAAPTTRIELRREEDAVFTIDRSVPGQPASGATVRVSRRLSNPEESVGRVDELGLHVPGFTLDVRAIAPDGAVALLRAVAEPIAFRPPRKLVVTMVEPSGAPLAEVELNAHFPGFWSTFERTDAKGVATFRSLPSAKTHVLAFTDGQKPWAMDVGAVDLTEGDGELRVTWGEPRTVVVHTKVRGEARLPPGTAVDVLDAVVLRREEDPVAARIRVTARPRDAAEPGQLQCAARDLRTGRARFAWPPARGTVETTVEFGDLGRVTLELRTADHDERVVLQRFDENGHWKTVDGGTVLNEAGRVTLPDLANGRYRILDVRTGIVSDPFEVADDAAPLEAVLDLSSLVTISGRVLAPGAGPHKGLKITVTGPHVDTFEGLVRVGSDGFFRLRLPAGGRYTLTPLHPEFRPAAEGGSVVVDGPRDDVVLRLVEGP